MSVTLPPLFLERMQTLLGEEYPDFVVSYDHPRFAGIRINTLKISPEAFAELTPFELKPVPWCETGYYIDEGQKPGKHPYYHAGLYYIQEPSAMAPAEALDVQPGDRVLDLCAAPGGKSTQIAARLQGQGVLVTNDISEMRTKALAKNIELYGVKNAVVLNESPERILQAFPGYFNKILIDAPCSGEGMFRKDEDMARQWEKHSVEVCSVMQRDILKSAAGMLAPGGTIVYSTCTFAPEEDEAQIAEFLTLNPDFEVVPLPAKWGLAKGRPDWLYPPYMKVEKGEYTEASAAQTGDAGRLWPHRIQGEGHFVAVLRHTGETGQPGRTQSRNQDRDFSEQHQEEQEQELDQGSAWLTIQPAPTAQSALSSRAAKDKTRQANKGKGKGRGRRQESAGAGAVQDQQELLAAWRLFAGQNLSDTAGMTGYPVFFGTNLYLSPLTPDQLNGLKTVRPGWYVGTVKNGRFVPGQPLAAALKPGESLRSVQLSLEEGEAVRYLKGETLQLPESRLVRLNDSLPKGYVLVGVGDYSLGWGKWQDGMLKNEYPAGWRWT
ncbi:rRNA cytosine-C5-methyltransferase [Paenibacillus yonginensis]|uniref:rRNA cytosine-C5-methyltransferase n=1 Tax=Paenibacillus yonginensis TaxID=1462996 RepID=A0A1B1MXG3_9BACL|nr:RsmB/NOP family class I SAM-dependent RNA methyltransferase [Paenibacillus yonginensis]ANS73856.1 rRNA cytosine-C5-methyltransferase [Paenibacillus yonginensis]